jgi:hypothetical protein
MDNIVGRVLRKYLDRADKGHEKYGVTLDREDLTIDQWLEHTQHELMDATLYIEKLRGELWRIQTASSPPPAQHSMARSDARKRMGEPEVPNQRISSHPYSPTPTLDAIRDEANRGS